MKRSCIKCLTGGRRGARGVPARLVTNPALVAFAADEGTRALAQPGKCLFCPSCGAAVDTLGTLGTQAPRRATFGLISPSLY